MGRSAAGSAVGVEEENTVVWDNSTTPASPMNLGESDVPFQTVRLALDDQAEGMLGPVPKINPRVLNPGGLLPRYFL